MIKPRGTYSSMEIVMMIEDDDIDCTVLAVKGAKLLKGAKCCTNFLPRVKIDP